MMFRFLVLAFVLCSLAVAPVLGTTIVIPTGSAGVEGSGSLGRPLGSATGQTTQFVYGSSLVGLPAGSVITEMAYRQDGGVSSTGVVSFVDYEITFSASLNGPGSLSTTFASNIGPDAVLVHDGALTVTNCPGGASPNAFCTPIPFASSYTYSGGDLLVTVSRTGATGAVDSVDASVDSNLQNVWSDGFHATTATDGFGFAAVLQLEYTQIPEPATYSMIGLGLAALGLIARFRRQRR